MFEPSSTNLPAPPVIHTDGWLPRAGSTLAKDIDFGWDMAMYVSVVIFFTVIIPMVYFMFKYKRKSDTEKTSELDHSLKLEIGWSVVPTIIVIWLFFVGLKGYVNASVAPRGAYEIQVTAQKWSWTFMYPNGVISSDLVVPVDRDVKLIMSATDVLHSLYVPEFRVKQDVVPGNYTTAWFRATIIGDTLLECAQYCGKDHSNMLRHVTVMSETDFNAWLDQADKGPGGPPEEWGAKLYVERGCNACHSTDGTPKAGGGPSFKGLFGKTETMVDNSTVTVDENYLKESILQSNAKVVKGYPAVMPVFQGQLKDKHVDALIAYIKSLK
jgi:cytochrome c oxidase subunit II